MAKGETDLCRFRLLKYCQGQGLDLGCGNTKIKPEAIGIDLLSPIADMHIDARLMPCYPRGHFDYIYSSHLLEEIEDTEATLKEWLRIIKDGGYLVLYQADKSLYYPLGHENCNPRHRHHFSWEDLWAVFEKIGDVELIHHASYPQQPYSEWSFELVVKKQKGKLIESKDVYEGISILIPTLNRPYNIDKFVTAINTTTLNPKEIEIIFGIHENDLLSKNKIDELKSKVKIEIRYEFIKKFEDNKIHLSYLWNQIYEKSKYPIIGYFGDDVIFQTPGWEEEVKKEFSKDKYIMVCCNDVHIQRGKQATLFFTHKKVHDKFGFYLHMKFRRWYADTYWDFIFRGAGKFHYREDIVTEHLHPDVFENKRDSVYIAMEEFKEKDKNIWLSQENRKEIENNIEILRGLHG